MRNYQRKTPRHLFGHRLKAASATSRPSVRDLAWAAGFYEGEGSCNYATGSEHMYVGQMERETVDRLQSLFGGSVRQYQGHHIPGYHSQPYWRWTVHGPRARGVLLTLYGLLSTKRRAQIRKVLAGHSKER
jgi:hypothetical protein